MKHQLFALKQTIDRNNLGYGVLLCGKNYAGRTTLCALIAETWSTNYINHSRRLDADADKDKDKSADVTVKTEKDTVHIKEGSNENDEKISDGPRAESGIHSKYFQDSQSSPLNKILKKKLISNRKKPVLVLVPRCGLIRWYSELKRTYAGCNVQLGFSNVKSHDNIKTEKLEDNDVEKEGEKGTLNTSASTSESESKYVIRSEPDVILCALENLHNLLEHCKHKNLNQKEGELSITNGNTENIENESDWCGVIVDSRSLNMAAMRSTMLLCMKTINPEILNTETAIKKQSDVGLKIKQEGRIYTSTVVLLNQTSSTTTTAATTTATATTSTVPIQNTIRKKKDLHWLNCLSDMLPPSLCNRCYLKSEKNSETAADNNLILSFLIPTLRSTTVEGPMGGPTGGQVQSPLPTISTDMNEVEVLKRLCVLVEVSDEDDVITQSRAKEEIITYDMDSVQRRKYVIAMDYFITQGVFSGTNITNLAKATIILKRLCYHQDMIYIDVENEEEVIERSNSKGSVSHTHVRTKSDLSIKDLPKITSEGKDKISSGSIDLGSLIPKDNKDVLEDNNKSDNNNVNENNDSSNIDYNDNKNGNKNDNDSNDRTSDSNTDKSNDKNDNSITHFSSSSLSDMKMDVCTDIVLACTDKSIPTGQEIILESDRFSGSNKNGKGNVPSYTLVNPQRYTSNEDVYLPGNTSYRTTSPAYVSGSKQHLWFSVGSLSCKLKSPVSFNMTSHVPPLSPHFSSSSLSPSFTSSNTTSPTVCTERSNGGDDTPNFRKNNMMLQNQMACVGSYKLQALEGLLLRFIGQRVAILSETEEEMLAVHRCVRTCVRVCTYT